LKYPIAKQIDLKHQKQVKQAITAILLIMIIPSVYFAYRLFDEKKYVQRTEEFIHQEFPQKEFTLIYKRTDYNSKPKILELAFLSKRFSAAEIKSLNKKLKEYDLINTQLRIKQDTFDLKNDILNTIGDYKKSGADKDQLIEELQKKISNFQTNNTKVSREVTILFPEVKPIAITQYASRDKTIPVLLYKSKTELNLDSKRKLMSWLKQRLEKDSVEVYRQR
jgi:hypothetical protein